MAAGSGTHTEVATATFATASPSGLAAPADSGGCSGNGGRSPFPVASGLRAEGAAADVLGPEVQGDHRTALECIRAGVLPQPPLLSWNEWQQWRCSFGRRPPYPPVKERGDFFAREARIRKIVMAFCHGPGWEDRLRQRGMRAGESPAARPEAEAAAEPASAERSQAGSGRIGGTHVEYVVSESPNLWDRMRRQRREAEAPLALEAGIGYGRGQAGASSAGPPARKPLSALSFSFESNISVGSLRQLTEEQLHDRLNVDFDPAK